MYDGIWESHIPIDGSPLPGTKRPLLVPCCPGQPEFILLYRTLGHRLKIDTEPLGGRQA